MKATHRVHPTRGFVVNFLVVLVSVTMSLAILEVLLRITGAEERIFPRVKLSGPSIRTQFYENIGGGPVVALTNIPGKTITYTYPDDPRMYFGKGLSVENRINILGFRGPNFRKEKEEGTIRIAFLGDSFTLGQGVRFEDTFPELVARELNRRMSDGGRRTECYNFAVGGSNAVNNAVILEMFAMGGRPDMVVLGWGLNDVEPPVFEWSMAGGKFYSRRRKRDLDRFENAGEERDDPGSRSYVTYRIFRKAVIRILASSGTADYYRKLYGEDNREWRDRNLRALERMAVRCAEEGIPFRVLILPVMYRLDDYPFGKIHDFLRNFLEERRIAYIDLFDVFRGMRDSDLWVHRADPHPNENAHAMIARAFLERVSVSSGDTLYSDRGKTGTASPRLSK